MINHLTVGLALGIIFILAIDRKYHAIPIPRGVRVAILLLCLAYLALCIVNLAVCNCGA